MTVSSGRLFVTHSGTFHLDDAFAYAALRITFGLGHSGTDHKLVRTRDEGIMAKADFVWDVGFVHDAAAGRFDHHQASAPVRDNGTPFSAAGLVWQHHGKAAVAALLGAAYSEPTFIQQVADEIDCNVVNRIDEIDHGEKHPGDTLGLSSIVEDCNLSWDALAREDQSAEDSAFVQASSLVEGFLKRRVEAIRARLKAKAVVLEAATRSSEPGVLELDCKMPWQEPVLQKNDVGIVYAVYPVANGSWMVDALPDKSGSYESRLPLPKAWAGLKGAELAEVTGISEATFVHRQMFVGAAKSRAAAMAMARKAIAMGLSNQ